MLLRLSAPLHAQQLVGVLTGVRAAAGLQETPGDSAQRKCHSLAALALLPLLPPFSGAAQKPEGRSQLQPHALAQLLCEDGGVKGFQTWAPAGPFITLRHKAAVRAAAQCRARSLLRNNRPSVLKARFPPAAPPFHLGLFLRDVAHSQEGGISILTFLPLPWFRWFCLLLFLPFPS